MNRKSIFEDLDFIRQRIRETSIEDGGCQCCGAPNARRAHQNTQYDYPAISKDPNAKAGDENDPNYATLCEPCWVENEEYWRERWDEYYSGCL